ncbi:MAG TPA: hypothetical protein VGS08_03595 [Candidatus Saccharimonadales bacterium]|nr:hypothetical protein [Candidatus Saccharimonadales bacterium]
MPSFERSQGLRILDGAAYAAWNEWCSLPEEERVAAMKLTRNVELNDGAAVSAPLQEALASEQNPPVNVAPVMGNIAVVENVTSL